MCSTNCYNCRHKGFDVGNSFIGCKKKQQVITNPGEDKQCYEASIVHTILDQIFGGQAPYASGNV